jgi:hypothetical protein
MITTLETVANAIIVPTILIILLPILGILDPIPGF